jgi:preprotein translocase subunit SecG
VTIAVILAILKLVGSFVLGYLTKHGVQKLADAQAANEAAESKASDPAQGNDVTDLEDV